MTRPTLVVFDLDDTLYEYEPCHRAGTRAWTAFAREQLNVTAQEWEEAISTARDDVKRRTSGTAASHSRLLYAATAVRTLGFGVNPTLTLALEQEYWRAFLLAMHLREGAADLIAALRYTGIPVAIVTDLTLQIQLRKLIRLGADTLVDYLVASEETSREKPDGHPFTHLVEQVADGCLDHVWFVGDAHHDVPIADLLASKSIGSGRGFLIGGTAPDGLIGVERISALEDVETALAAALEG